MGQQFCVNRDLGQPGMTQAHMMRKEHLKNKNRNFKREEKRDKIKELQSALYKESNTKFADLDQRVIMPQLNRAQS